ncbi:hypothetical protein [Fluviispira multicolorata]|uniref:Uncharacterized protein n=1 Tax=Fluviispira multicolorata TaxID=2654512 RepID=A0A833JFE8_9BACT|nr:hypothetical protein [Fluviispira multicolorata]KAB8033711.1 hypothetical protein GCL57_03115 [Fluviispira multicolorata]
MISSEQIKNIEYVILYSDLSSNPEKTVEEILYFLNMNINIENFKTGYCVIPYKLFQPWLGNEVFLNAYYRIIPNNNKLIIESILVEEIEAPQNDSSEVHNKNAKLFNVRFENNESKPQKNTITVKLDLHSFQDLNKKYSQNSDKGLIFKINEPFLFDPVAIPKPWGQEIWFTGVEKRGVSNIKTFVDNSTSLPFPWIFSALPSLLQGAEFSGKNLTLVKILDPLPDEVYGDLYYELHTEKNEVYIVTDITSTNGRIKFGANTEKLKSFSNQNDYKDSFLICIKKYEEIRRKIDSIIDEFRITEGIDLNLPLPAEKIKLWHKSIPEELLSLEFKMRQEMDSYAGYLNLNIGDVISVSTHIPHALQHGVRVIEFQTPTYERLIISFAQKVLTQAHWDSEDAIAIMNVHPPQMMDLDIIEQNDLYLEELVCSFKEFTSTRIIINHDCIYRIKSENKYKILFLVSGSIKIIDKNQKEFLCQVGNCVFLSANTDLSLLSDKNSVILMCYPN